MHYIVLEKEKLNGAFPKLRTLSDGRVVMPVSLLDRIRFSLEDVDLMTEKDVLELK